MSKYDFEYQNRIFRLSSNVKILIKTIKTLKYLNDISGNLLQIFEGKDITSNLENNVEFFMSETVCQLFCRK